VHADHIMHCFARTWKLKSSHMMAANIGLHFKSTVA